MLHCNSFVVFFFLLSLSLSYSFYGFRKIKSDPLRIRDAEADIEAKYWRFRHEKFLKGRPELLSEIKKSSHTEAAEKQEVDALKNEVKDLKEKLESTTRNMEKLASMVEIMMKSQQSQHEMLKLHQAHQNQYVQDGISKKRKVIPEPSLPPSPVKSSVLDDRCPIQPLPVTSLPDPSTACDSDLYGGSPSLGIYSSPSLLPATPSCEDSIDSLSPMDELLHSLFSNEGSNNIIDEKPFDIPDLPLSSNFAKSSPPEPDALLVQKLRSSLAKLPKELQELFVERLVAVIADPEKFQNQVEAVSALAAMAAEEAKKKLKSNGGNSSIENNNEEAVEVATAVLGSFLARYGASLNGKAVAQAQASMVPMET